ncbi:MAG: hypothetical protein NTV73_02125 [Hyphomicrobiales bacterium]|nr:hypothetical protein [Hyphomicrobiales bacterium]
MASAFSRFRGDIEDDLEAQVARLTKELAMLRKSAGKRGSVAYGDARGAAADLYGDLRERFIEAIPIVRKQAKAADRAARDNPTVTAAVVGLAVVGLLVTMIARR